MLSRRRRRRRHKKHGRKNGQQHHHHHRRQQRGRQRQQRGRKGQQQQQQMSGRPRHLLQNGMIPAKSEATKAGVELEVEREKLNSGNQKRPKIDADYIDEDDEDALKR